MKRLTLNTPSLDAPWWFWVFFLAAMAFTLLSMAGTIWIGWLLIHALQRYLAS